MQRCILCQSNKTALYYQDHNRRYCNCNTCGCVFIPHEALPGAKEEKERYLSHQNDVENSGFQKFVSPIVNAIKAKHTTKEKGLDFGAGTGPVVSKLLEDFKTALLVNKLQQFSRLSGFSLVVVELPTSLPSLRLPNKQN